MSQIANRRTCLAMLVFLLAGFCTITPGRLIHVDDNMSDSQKDSVWIDPCDYLQDASDVEPGNGNTLIAELGRRRVIEFDSSGTIIWQHTRLNDPWDADAERLDNGNTLITQAGNGRVIEVDSLGTIVWQIDGLNSPWDAER